MVKYTSRGNCALSKFYLTNDIMVEQVLSVNLEHPFQSNSQDSWWGLHPMDPVPYKFKMIS